jgi:hypothetical protein
MTWTNCGGQGGLATASNAGIAKASIALLAWSSVLMAMFEVRMKAEVTARVKELTKTYDGMMADHVSDMHAELFPRHLRSVESDTGESQDKTSEESETVSFTSKVASSVQAGDIILKAVASNATSDQPLKNDENGGTSSITLEAETLNVPQDRVEQTSSENQPLPDIQSTLGEDGHKVQAVSFLEPQGNLTRSKGRRLPGFYTSGAAGNGVSVSGCIEIADPSLTYDFANANCAGGTTAICAGCFVVTSLTDNTKLLKIMSCSTAFFKTSAQVDGTTNTLVMVIEVINTDTNNYLTIQACPAGCGSITNSYRLGAYDSVKGYCYHGSSDRIYWAGSSGIQNADPLDFNGKTITDLGSVEAGTFDNTLTISGATTLSGSGTLTLSGHTLALGTNQITATAISPGAFSTGTSWSFSGSTIQAAVIEDATLHYGTIGSAAPSPTTTLQYATVSETDITMSSGKTLDITSGTFTCASTVKGSCITGAPSPSPVADGLFTTSRVYSFQGSTIAALGTVSAAEDFTLSGSGKTMTISDASTLNVAGTTSTLDVDGVIDFSGAQSCTIAASLIPASGIKPGTAFPAPTPGPVAASGYSFGDATIANLGTVEAAAFDGGGTTTMNGASVNIGGSTQVASVSASILIAGDSSASTTQPFRIANAGTATISGVAASGNYQLLVVTSATSNLANGATETLQITNVQASANCIAFVSIVEQCAGGDYLRADVMSCGQNSNRVDVRVRNSYGGTCASTYKIGIMVVKGNTR